MQEKILDWDLIKTNYKDSTILIGNGASIAIWDKFNYKELLKLINKEEKTEKTHGKTIKELFDRFKSSDFELILRKLSHAAYINEILNIKDDEKKITTNYNLIREFLIKAIGDIHPKHNEVEDKLESLYDFIKYFKRIISLNYDLLIYWAVMKGNEKTDKTGYKIKDCFHEGAFNHNWTEYSDPKQNSQEKYSQLLFYLHGNLALAYNEDENESEIKIQLENQDKNLLDTIIKKWKKNYYPLFVSEGEAKQKKNAIARSPYLSTVYNTALKKLPSCKLTIYGFSFNEQDLYILEKIAKSNKITKVAVSVYDNNSNYCSTAKERLKKTLNIIDNSIEFFDSKTAKIGIKKTAKIFEESPA